MTPNSTHTSLNTPRVDPQKQNARGHRSGRQSFSTNGDDQDESDDNDYNYESQYSNMNPIGNQNNDSQDEQSEFNSNEQTNEQNEFYNNKNSNGNNLSSNNNEYANDDSQSDAYKKCKWNKKITVTNPETLKLISSGLLKPELSILTK